MGQASSRSLTVPLDEYERTLRALNQMRKFFLLFGLFACCAIQGWSLDFYVYDGKTTCTR